MKKFLLFSAALALFTNANAQQIEVKEKYVGTLNLSPSAALSKAQAVNDTLTQPVFGANCDPSLYTYSGASGQAIVGTYSFSPTITFTDVAQLLNLGERTVKVEALLFFVSGKTAGAGTSGSFTAEIYDTLGGPSALRPDYTPEAVSSPVTYANIDTVFPGINRFSFPTPYSTSSYFWASLNVDNGNDTISVYSTGNDCGGAQPTALFNANDTLWLYYHNTYSIGGDPLDFALWVWAEVDTAGSGVGLDRNLISNKGLKFYPNPATDYATIEFAMPNESDVTLVIQDMTGREIYRKEQSFNNGERSFNLDLSSYNKGAYTYQVIGKRRQLNGVFVKQ